MVAHALLQRLKAAGATVIGTKPEAFARFNQQEVVRWSALIKKLNVTID